MKIVFSTKNVSRASFLDTCRYAYDYGFEGFEIYDAIKEMHEEDPPERKFSIKKLLIEGVATSIDALAVGISFA